MWHVFSDPYCHLPKGSICIVFFTDNERTLHNNTEEKSENRPFSNIRLFYFTMEISFIFFSVFHSVVHPVFRQSVSRKCFIPSIFTFSFMCINTTVCTTSTVLNKSYSLCLFLDFKKVDTVCQYVSEEEFFCCGGSGIPSYRTGGNSSQLNWTRTRVPILLDSDSDLSLAPLDSDSTRDMRTRTWLRTRQTRSWAEDSIILYV